MRRPDESTDSPAASERGVFIVARCTVAGRRVYYAITASGERVAEVVAPAGADGDTLAAVMWDLLDRLDPEPIAARPPERPSLTLASTAEPRRARGRRRAPRLNVVRGDAPRPRRQTWRTLPGCVAEVD